MIRALKTVDLEKSKIDDGMKLEMFAGGYRQEEGGKIIEHPQPSLLDRLIDRIAGRSS